MEACASPEKLLEGNLILACQEFFNASLTNHRRRQRHAARMLTAVANSARVFHSRLEATGGFSAWRNAAAMESVLAAVRGKTPEPKDGGAQAGPLRTAEGQVS